MFLVPFLLHEIWLIHTLPLTPSILIPCTLSVSHLDNAQHRATCLAGYVFSPQTVKVGIIGHMSEPAFLTRMVHTLLRYLAGRVHKAEAVGICSFY